MNGSAPNPRRPLSPIKTGALATLAAIFVTAGPTVGLASWLEYHYAIRFGFWELLLTLPAPLFVGGLAMFGCSREMLHRERRKNGLCVRCGYDLRASAERCPECGKRFRRLVRS